MTTLKYSRQREAIKTFLMNRADHPSADTVYTCLRKEYPNISLGTVYRNLSLLADLGEIVKIPTGDGADRFDGDTHKHHHFICRCCHEVYDMDVDGVDSILDLAASNYAGRVDSYRLNFYGMCESCINQSKEEILVTGSSPEDHGTQDSSYEQ